MNYRFARLTLGLVVGVATATTGAWAHPSLSMELAPEPQAAAPQAAAQESPYKDQGEYDLATAAGKETDPQKKLDKLKEWEQKYPDSKLKSTRTVFQAQAYLAIAMGAYGKSSPPELLDAGQKAAQTVLDNLDNYFSPANMPTGATEAVWAGARKTSELQMHSVLAWIDSQRKDYAKAETEYKVLLQLNPDDAQSSYSLGSAIIGQKNVARYSEAMYDMARSLAITGPTALPPAGQQAAEQYLNRVYAGYHGDDVKDPKAAQQVKDDIAKLKQQAASAPLPPAGFHIDSATEVQAKQFGDIDAFNKAHPDVALWRLIRDTLKGDGGDTYFSSMKGSQVPPENIGMFKAKIVTVNDKDLIVNVDNAGGDATLKFEKSINAKAINVGDALEFKGVAEAFTKEPYMLTLTIDDPKESIKGLPDNAFSAAPARKTAPKKAAPKKK